MYNKSVDLSIFNKHDCPAKITGVPRQYRKRQRAALEDETRRRITEATVALHQEVGPARTTISAIAERAGVQRLTVYRHFPDEAALLRACGAHFMAQHPPPDLAAWGSIADPDERLRRALTQLYDYYYATEAMTANILRDAPAMPALAAQAADLPRFFSAAQELLLAGRDTGTEVSGRVRAAVGHALQFSTWRSLVREQGLDRDGAVDLMMRLVTGSR